MIVNTYIDLLAGMDAGKRVVMVTVMDNKNKFLFTEESLRTHNCTFDFDEMVFEKAKFALETGNLQFFKADDNKTYLIEPYFPEPHLIVLGGGHIARPLVEFGAKVGFAVTIIDDRPSFANREEFPDAENVICESFDKCFDSISLNESSFVVIITRGHRHDMDCLREVLKHSTAYTGMIGSKRRINGVREQMLSEGYSKEKLDKVNAPIGLDIGAITPEEIAISIISQIISYRRHLNPRFGNTKPWKSNWPEFNRDVLTNLSSGDDSPKAIVTILSTKGSVPRKAGTKMLVWPYGKILGSIGGGCSEGEVIVNTRDVIRNGGYKLQSIDMTADFAEEEGMVCGGVMDVIIESFDKL